jgi:hypothetical protein
MGIPNKQQWYRAEGGHDVHTEAAAWGDNSC